MNKYREFTLWRELSYPLAADSDWVGDLDLAAFEAASPKMLSASDDTLQFLVVFDDASGDPVAAAGALVDLEIVERTVFALDESKERLACLDSVAQVEGDEITEANLPLRSTGKYALRVAALTGQPVADKMRLFYRLVRV